jgi:hypothetical protein
LFGKQASEVYTRWGSPSVAIRDEIRLVNRDERSLTRGRAGVVPRGDVPPTFTAGHPHPK